MLLYRGFIAKLHVMAMEKEQVHNLTTQNNYNIYHTTHNTMGTLGGQNFQLFLSLFDLFLTPVQANIYTWSLQSQAIYIPIVTAGCRHNSLLAIHQANYVGNHYYVLSQLQVEKQRLKVPWPTSISATRQDHSAHQELTSDLYFDDKFQVFSFLLRQKTNSERYPKNYQSWYLLRLVHLRDNIFHRLNCAFHISFLPQQNLQLHNTTINITFPPSLCCLQSHEITTTNS